MSFYITTYSWKKLFTNQRYSKTSARVCARFTSSLRIAFKPDAGGAGLPLKKRFMASDRQIMPNRLSARLSTISAIAADGRLRSPALPLTYRRYEGAAKTLIFCLAQVLLCAMDVVTRKGSPQQAIEACV